MDILSEHLVRALPNGGGFLILAVRDEVAIARSESLSSSSGLSNMVSNFGL